MNFFKGLAVSMASVMFMSVIGGSKVYAASNNEETLPNLYDKNFKPASMKILSEEEAESKGDVKVAMVRQENQKINFMIKDKDGTMKPFYSKALETGFWDTRKQGQVTDWDKVFQDFKDMGVNTVQLMVQWQDWEPEKGVFDYNFLDTVVNKASEKGLKVYFAIFFHYQWNMDTKYDDFWAYHLEDRDGKNYSIMWGEGNKNNIASIRRNSLEVFPEYWHPLVFPELMKAITNLADHYKDSSDVIAYQLGNEEGFNYYLNNGNDTNPYYAKLFEKWKKETGKNSEADFRLETIQNIWKHMTDAVHKVDPYKPTITNFQGGLPEKIGGFNWNEGVNPSFYKDANLDLVGPMFYGNDGYKIWNNLDPIYDYTKSSPVLFPSEIGAAGKNSIAMKTYLMNTLERGAVGFGIYCYGEMLGTIHDGNLRRLISMIDASEDIIYSGLPVDKNVDAKNIFLSTNTGGFKVSNLEKDSDSVLGLLYAPDVVRYGNAEINSNVEMTLNVKKADNYKIQVYTDGNLISTEKKDLSENSSYKFDINMSNYSNTFVKVTSSSVIDVPEEKNENIALHKSVVSNSEENVNPVININDGSEYTRWCAKDGSENNWVKIDLGDNYKINSSEINWEKLNAYKYKIEVSSDDKTWNTVVDKTANSTQLKITRDNFKAEGRFIKVTVTGGVSSRIWASIYELKVFGSSNK